MSPVPRFGYRIGHQKGAMSEDAALDLAVRIGRLGLGDPEVLAKRIEEHVAAVTTEEMEFSPVDVELVAMALLPPSLITREKFVERLAHVSHNTWMRQAHRDKGIPRGELSAEVTDHDRERAEDTVRELERLRIL